MLPKRSASHLPAARQGMGHNAKINRGQTLLRDKPIAASRLLRQEREQLQEPLRMACLRDGHPPRRGRDSKAVGCLLQQLSRRQNESQ